MKPIDYKTGLRQGYSPLEWVILGVCFLLIAVLVSALAGCTYAPQEVDSTTGSINFVTGAKDSGFPTKPNTEADGKTVHYTIRFGGKGLLCEPFVHADYLLLLKTYGTRLAEPNPANGWDLNQDANGLIWISIGAADNYGNMLRWQRQDEKL